MVLIQFLINLSIHHHIIIIMLEGHNPIQNNNSSKYKKAQQAFRILYVQYINTRVVPNFIRFDSYFSSQRNAINSHSHTS